VEIWLGNFSEGKNVPGRVKEVKASGEPSQLYQADIQDLCIGDIPILVGSCLCHQGVTPSQPAAYFIVMSHHAQLQYYDFRRWLRQHSAIDTYAFDVCDFHQRQ
jgi:hypothetical protein